jgi:hypothetical protein
VNDQTPEGSKTEQPQSVSRILCTASIRGKGSAEIGIYRHMAPLTVNALMRVFPIQSRVNLQDAVVCMFTTVRVGVEKSRTTFSRGEIAFLPSNALICVFVKEVKSDMPLNPIGKVEDGMKLFDSVRLGDVIELRVPQEATVHT